MLFFAQFLASYLGDLVKHRLAQARNFWKKCQKKSQHLEILCQIFCYCVSLAHNFASFSHFFCKKYYLFFIDFTEFSLWDWDHAKSSQGNSVKQQRCQIQNFKNDQTFSLKSNTYWHFFYYFESGDQIKQILLKTMTLVDSEVDKTCDEQVMIMILIGTRILSHSSL